MEQRFVQILATLIIVFGAVCVGVSDKYAWRDLTNAGMGIIGTGAGILTGQKLATYTHTEGGSINLNPIGPPDPKA